MEQGAIRISDALLAQGGFGAAVRAQPHPTDTVEITNIGKNVSTRPLIITKPEIVPEQLWEKREF